MCVPICAIALAAALGVTDGAREYRLDCALIQALLDGYGLIVIQNDSKRMGVLPAQHTAILNGGLLAEMLLRIVSMMLDRVVM